MNDLFILEFNEDQQGFHHNYYKRPENTFGWITICEHCSDLESIVFESFLNRTKEKTFTKEHVVKSFNECKQFINNLTEYNIMIFKPE